MNIVHSAAGVLTDGITKAIETLWPMDHPGAERAQALHDADEAA